jgi:hypothetical protein
MTANPAPSEATETVAVDPDVLRRVEANLARLLALAAPHCASEPESYDLADAEAAHAELVSVLVECPDDAAGARTATGGLPGYQRS